MIYGIYLKFQLVPGCSRESGIVQTKAKLSVSPEPCDQGVCVQRHAKYRTNETNLKKTQNRGPV